MRKINSWKFGDTKKEADDLLNLVLSGKKKGTSSLYGSYKDKKLLPKVGDRIIIKNSKNEDKCLIVISSVEIKPFGKVTKRFATKEGEGNLSLSHWKKTHKKFFEKRIKINDDTLVVCEEFKVLKRFKNNLRSNCKCQKEVLNSQLYLYHL